jgi:Domain of unknown function (DUF5666)
MIGETLITANSELPRLTRVAILAATGVTALSVAACSSSNQPSPSSAPSTSSTTSSSPSSSPTPGAAEAHVNGLIASVAGNTIQVTQENQGNAAVNFTDSTKITEVTPAALTDVTTGSCVSVRPTHEEGGQPVTAAFVRVSQPVDGKCQQGKENAPGGSTTPAPPGSPTTAPAKKPFLRGSVASVAGNTINITTTDAGGSTSQTAVTVDDKTKYSKRGTANGQAIAAGKCLAARGTKDSSGTLQATTINLWPAHDGNCGGHGKEPHGHGG